MLEDVINFEMAPFAYLKILAFQNSSNKEIETWISVRNSNKETSEKYKIYICEGNQLIGIALST